jgi:peptidoglycan/LPS O-acetylase OafA/YrhL
MNKVRLYPIDALHGLAAVFVVLYHMSENGSFKLITREQLFPHIDILQVFVQGTLPVQLFFFLSGFTMYLVYSERIRDNTVSAEEFAIARISRLIPLCWLSACLTAIPTFMMRLLYGDTAFTMTGFFADILLLSGRIITIGKIGVNRPMWTMSPQMVAYVLFFFVFWKIHKTKRNERSASFNEVLITSLLLVLSLALYKLNFEYPIIHKDFVRVFSGFFAGILTCVGWRSVKAKRTKNIVAGISGFITVINILALAYFPSLVKDWQFIHSCVTFPAVIMACLTIKPLNWFMSLAPFRWLGHISFSVYLLHHFVLYTIAKLNEYGVTDINYASRKILLIVLIFIFGISTLSYYLYEKPMQSYIRRKWKERMDAQGV